MPTARLRDIDVYYEQAGNGPPLLLIPGTNADLRRQPRFIDGPLSQHFTVLTLDQRGLGRTDKPDRDYSMDDYALDAVALLDYVGWPSARVLGISFGGSVAQQLALQFPERVTRLALACSNPGGELAYPLHELEDVEPLQRARTLLSLDLRRTSEWQAANPVLVDRLLSEFVRRGTPVDENDLAARKGLRRQLEARRGHHTIGQLKDLRTPTALFAGRSDGLGSKAAQEAMASEIPGALLQYFEGGHGFLNEDPAAIQAIIAFLSANA